MDYSAEIRRLSTEYAELTGTSPYSGVSRPRRGGTESYIFDDGYFDNGPEALGHMRERLAGARMAKGDRL